MAKQFDVVIVGAGMVGASLALLMRQCMQQGLSVALLDEHGISAEHAQQPSFDDRTTALSLGTQRIMEELGIWRAMGVHGCAIEHIQVSQQKQFGRVRLHAQDEHVDALGYVLPNRAIGQVLSQGLLASEHLTILAPASVTQYAVNAHGAQLQVQLASGKETIQAGLLVLADGAQSEGCRQLGIAQTRHSYEQHAVICNVSFDRPHEHWAYERFTLGGPLALLPMQGNRYGLVWCMQSHQAQEYLALDDQAFSERLQQTLGFDKGRLVKVGARASYPLALTKACEQVRQHVVVLGNAAHGLHPVAGQGFNLALRDAYVLAKNIQQTFSEFGRDQVGQLSHLLAYEQAQVKDQALTIGMSHYLPTSFAQAGSVWSVLRGLGLTLMDQVPVAKTLFARQAMGLVGSVPPWRP